MVARLHLSPGMAGLLIRRAQHPDRAIDALPGAKPTIVSGLKRRRMVTKDGALTDLGKVAAESMQKHGERRTGKERARLAELEAAADKRRRLKQERKIEGK
jgi:hypothetical protein